MKIFTLIFFLFGFSITSGFAQFDPCPCNPSAIVCDCLPPEPGNDPPSDNQDDDDDDNTGDEYSNGFQDGFSAVTEFISYAIMQCDGGFGSTIAIILNPTHNPVPYRVTVIDGKRLTVSRPAKALVVEIGPGGRNADCVDDIRPFVQRMPETIQSYIDSPGNNGRSRDYWIGFLSGVESGMIF